MIIGKQVSGKETMLKYIAELADKLFPPEECETEEQSCLHINEDK